MSLKDYEKDVKKIRKIISNSKTPIVVMIGFLETEKARLMKQAQDRRQREVLMEYLQDIDERQEGKNKGVS